jgi:hypothetical protein
MAHECGTGTPVDSLEEFRSLVLEKFRQKLRCGEKQAAEAGQTVVDEFNVGADNLSKPLLRIRYLCEPGKPARVLTVEGPEDCSALFIENDRPPRPPH